ncbi:transcription factor bHLH7-like [Trifolium pratense]|uniref:transcription factor bHLH7-like n=1 Tax=Trifolium pratense TaxID=57577 RepID=UPI001E691D55|nr:transcription factor bHLH7-like [Trifolium pratense]XP_045833651.1 transcription factor bHLH7-like [Trifolium pratense]
MEGESNKDNNSSEVSHDNEETSSHDISEDHQIQNQQFVETSGTQWSSLPKLPQNNYVEYLSESSASYLPNPTIHGNNYQNFGGGSSSFNDSGKAAFDFKFIGSSSTDFGIKKRVGFRRYDEGKEVIKAEIGSSHNLLCAQGHATWTPDSVGDKQNASRFDPMGMVAAPSLLQRSRGSSSKQRTEKARYTDRQRRQRLADNLKALHELLPNPEMGSQAQAYILDDIIDYVNYLQVQVKELSGSKLQADSNAIPLVFHEGYGHYIKGQMLNEPLEEIMGKLLEEDSAAASQLLEKKGLIMLPISLADDLNQAIQLWNQSSM